MSRLDAMVNGFLAQKRIAVAGVSHTDTNQAANAVYKKLRGAGYQVFALNPNAQEVEGDACYADLKALPEKVDGIVIRRRWRPQTRSCGSAPRWASPASGYTARLGRGACRRAP